MSPTDYMFTNYEYSNNVVPYFTAQPKVQGGGGYFTILPNSAQKQFRGKKFCGQVFKPHIASIMNTKFHGEIFHDYDLTYETCENLQPQNLRLYVTQTSYE